MSKFAKCQFHGSGRAYTYATDGHDVAIGDKVKVASPRDESMVTVEVVGLTDEEPPSECKPILEKVEPALLSSEENEHGE